MRLTAAVALGLFASAGLASAANARTRVAIPDFQIEGGSSPALGIQLQDGFVLGLVRGGIQVLDPIDTARRLEGHPELQHCDASPCLKSIGQLLDVGYVVRARVEVAGNSYKSVVRLFSTEGAAPAALPIATESKSCDVCTVEEARGTMLKLADALRGHIDELTPPAPPAPPAPPPAPPHLVGPILLAMAGAVAVATGGLLIGVGAAFTLTGAYVTIVRSRGGDPVTGVAVAWRW
jgi:hypothetical protein